MVSELESVDNGTLVLIEEIENGLHPVAVAKMIEYLFDLSDRKKIQVIFTTHSDVATGPLPREAVWASVDGRLQQGKLSVEATRAISGRVDRRLSVFVEDEFAKLWVEMIFARHLAEDARQVGVFALSGDSVALKVHMSHRENPTVQTRSILLLDGDSSIQGNESIDVKKLPGDQPEAYIYDYALSQIDHAAAMLAAMCHYDVNNQQSFIDRVRKVATNTADPHLYFSKLGIELGFISELVIKRAFITYWLNGELKKSEDIAQFIRERLTVEEQNN